jgi:hypothetical protein
MESPVDVRKTQKSSPSHTRKGSPSRVRGSPSQSPVVDRRRPLVARNRSISPGRNKTKSMPMPARNRQKAGTHRRNSEGSSEEEAEISDSEFERSFFGGDKPQLPAKNDHQGNSDEALAKRWRRSDGNHDDGYGTSDAYTWMTKSGSSSEMSLVGVHERSGDGWSNRSVLGNSSGYGAALSRDDGYVSAQPRDSLLQAAAEEKRNFRNDRISRLIKATATGVGGDAVNGERGCCCCCCCCCCC